MALKNLKINKKTIIQSLLVNFICFAIPVASSIYGMMRGGWLFFLTIPCSSKFIPYDGGFGMQNYSLFFSLAYMLSILSSFVSLIVFMIIIRKQPHGLSKW